MHERTEQPNENSIPIEATTVQSTGRAKRVWRRALRSPRCRERSWSPWRFRRPREPGSFAARCTEPRCGSPLATRRCPWFSTAKQMTTPIKVEVYQFGTFPTVPFFLGDQVPFTGEDGKKHFDLTLNVSHGPLVWENDNVTTFSVREKLNNGTWQWMGTGTNAGNDRNILFSTGNAIIGVADQPDQVANFPSVFDQAIAGQPSGAFVPQRQGDRYCWRRPRLLRRDRWCPGQCHPRTRNAERLEVDVRISERRSRDVLQE